MRKIAFLARRADIFCRRLNDGMTAIAVVLAVLMAALTLEQRLPYVLHAMSVIDPETGVSLENF
jgi:hypothetical protein